MLDIVATLPEALTGKGKHGVEGTQTTQQRHMRTFMAALVQSGPVRIDRTTAEAAGLQLPRGNTPVKTTADALWTQVCSRIRERGPQAEAPAIDAVTNAIIEGSTGPPTEHRTHKWMTTTRVQTFPLYNTREVNMDKFRHFTQYAVAFLTKSTRKPDVTHKTDEIMRMVHMNKEPAFGVNGRTLMFPTDYVCISHVQTPKTLPGSGHTSLFYQFIIQATRAFLASSRLDDA